MWVPFGRALAALVVDAEAVVAVDSGAACVGCESGAGAFTALVFGAVGSACKAAGARVGSKPGGVIVFTFSAL